MKPLRVVTYSRVSTEDQADYGTGLETQVIENARYAERIGAVVIAAESDPGVSGTIYPRPGLERALVMLEQGKADALIAHRVDRLGREQWIPPFVHKRIKVARCRLFTVEDGEVTDDNVLLFSLRCGMAQTDYNRIIKNLQGGKRRLAEKGRMPARTYAPYGYHIVQKIEAGQVRDDAGTYVIVEEEAQVVRTIFTRYAAGESLSAICRYLQEQGISTPRPDLATSGRTCWQPTVISRILKNTAYKGYVLWGKTHTTYKDKTELSFDERLNCRTETGRKKIVEEMPDPVRIEVSPIVSEEQWEACQERMQTNSELSGIRNDRKHLFASLIVCPNCGRKMNAGHANYQKRPPSERPVLYRCKDHAKSQNAAGYICHKPYYREDVIHPALRRFFLTLFETPAFIIAAFQAYQQRQRADYSQEEHAQIINDLRELDKRESATAEAYARAIGLGTQPEVFEKLLTDIAIERKRLNNRKASLEALRTEKPEHDPKKVAEVVGVCARAVLEMLDSETLSSVEKNTALRRVIAEIKPVGEGFRIASHVLTQVVNHEQPVTGIVIPVR